MIKSFAALLIVAAFPVNSVAQTWDPDFLQCMNICDIKQRAEVAECQRILGASPWNLGICIDAANLRAEQCRQKCWAEV